jgi:hypothetical protein
MRNIPWLTVLSYSAGVQSEALFYMVYFGDIPEPPNLVVMRSNPGMENSLSEGHAREVKRLCGERGWTYCEPVGGNLYTDLLDVQNRKRIDNPPYWVLKGRDENGKLLIGKLIQGCTQYYKVAPMDREVRRLFRKRYGRGKKSPPKNSVEKWIGFAADEAHRISLSRTRYAYFRHPLVELGMNKTDVVRYYRQIAKPIPPRSVCNACFANGLQTLREMYMNRPHDWAQAVAVDEAVRDMSSVGVKYSVFVSPTCIPLTQLAAQGFVLTPRQIVERSKKPEHACGNALMAVPTKADSDEYSCDSGHCFI